MQAFGFTFVRAIDLDVVLQFPLASDAGVEGLAALSVAVRMPVMFERYSWNPSVPTASTATATQTTGHQRRESGRPSGKSRTTMRSVPTTKFCPPLPREATTFTAGSDPGAGWRSDFR